MSGQHGLPARSRRREAAVGYPRVPGPEVNLEAEYRNESACRVMNGFKLTYYRCSVDACRPHLQPLQHPASPFLLLSLPSIQPNQRQSSYSSLAISHSAHFSEVRFALGECLSWRLSSQQGPFWGLREVTPARNMMVIIVSRLAPKTRSSCSVLVLVPSRGQMKFQLLGWLDAGLHRHMQPCLLSAI